MGMTRTPPVDTHEACALLADKTKLTLLLHLAVEERCVSALTYDLNLPQATVSHHLGILVREGLVARRQAGRYAFFSLASDEPLGDDTLMSIATRTGSIPIRQRVRGT